MNRNWDYLLVPHPQIPTQYTANLSVISIDIELGIQSFSNSLSRINYLMIIVHLTHSRCNLCSFLNLQIPTVYELIEKVIILSELGH